LMHGHCHFSSSTSNISKAYQVKVIYIHVKVSEICAIYLDHRKDFLGKAFFFIHNNSRINRWEHSHGPWGHIFLIMWLRLRIQILVFSSSLPYHCRIRYHFLKEPWHEIFDLCFFLSNNFLWPLMHGLKPFWIWISIRRENRLCNRRFLSQWCKWLRCARHSGVNDTAVQQTFPPSRRILSHIEKRL
jgi:hypothetical protein